MFVAATLPPETGTTLTQNAQRAMTSETNIKAFLQAMGGLAEHANDAGAREAVAAMHDDGVHWSDVFEQFRVHATKQRLRSPLVCVFGEADPLTLGWEQRSKDWNNYFEHVTSHGVAAAGTTSSRPTLDPSPICCDASSGPAVHKRGHNQALDAKAVMSRRLHVSYV